MIIKTRTQGRIVNALKFFTPDFDSVVMQYMDHPDFDPANEFHFSRYMKWFGNIALSQELADLVADRWPIMPDIRRAIREGAKTRNYRFFYDRGENLFAALRYSDHKARPLGSRRYDKVILARRTPIVFEVKTRKWKRSSSTIGGYTYKDIVCPDFYEEKLRPLSEFFRICIGYVVVVPKDIYINHCHGPIMKGFKKGDGSIVPIGLTTAEYRQEVLEALVRNGLKYSPGSENNKQ